MTSAPPTPLRTWLQLLRAPNLFTVPGDPLAGFLLASSGRIDERLAYAILASLCFYSHGLLLNDLADLAEDRRERPERPLPSGAARLLAVRATAALLAVAALLLCHTIGRPALLVGLALLGVIVLYNLWAKRIAVLGPINMGLCRGLSLLLGASATLTPASDPAHPLPGVVFLAATSLTLYIAAITHLARIETLADPPPLPRRLPYATLTLVIVAFFISVIDHTHPLTPANIGLYLLSAYTLYAGYKIHGKLTHQPAPPIPPMIGQLIRLLLPLQAIFCLASRSLAGGIAAALLLALWPVSRAVSRRFYAS
jgi:4-hydroxybenzoate polyprenyltransferase